MVLPELLNDRVIIKIFSNGAKLNNLFVKERCEEYNSDINIPSVFLIIVFNGTKEGILKGIEIQFLNHNADTLERINMLKSIYT